MIEEEQRPRYWLYTLSMIAAVVGMTLVCAFLIPPFTSQLNVDSVLGFPLGFYFAAQGLVIMLIIVVNWAVSRQAEIDRKFGAIEDL